MGCQISVLQVKSCSVMSNSLRPYRLQPTRLLYPWDSPGKNAGIGCHALLQGIFPTQRSNPGLPHGKRILYHLSHQVCLRILEWVVHPFSRGASQPRDQTRVSWIADGFFTSWAPWEAPFLPYWCIYEMTGDWKPLGSFRIQSGYQRNQPCD